MSSYKTTDSIPDTLEEAAVSYARQDYWQLADRSISKSYIKTILELARLSLADLMEIVPISIDSYKRKTVFSPAVTEKILEIEEVYKTGLDAFGVGFHDWMNTINPSLGGIKPKALLTNSFGVRRLLTEIGRMQYGVLA